MKAPLIVLASTLISALLKYGVYQIIPGDRNPHNASSPPVSQELAALPSPPPEPSPILIGGGERTDTPFLSSQKSTAELPTTASPPAISNLEHDSRFSRRSVAAANTEETPSHTAFPQQAPLLPRPSCEHIESKIIEKPGYQRNLETWKPQIQAYSARHYGENTWKLEPKVIVLHYTVSTSFPFNLVNTDSFDGKNLDLLHTMWWMVLTYGGSCPMMCVHGELSVSITAPLILKWWPWEKRISMKTAGPL